MSQYKCYNVSGSGSRRRAVFISLMITAGIFLFLPFSEFLTRAKTNLFLREIDRTLMKKTLPEKPPRTRKLEKKELPKPKLTRPRERLMPLQLAANFGLDLDPGYGDFNLNFSLTPAFSSQDLVFELSEVDVPPQPLARIAPLYPMAAKLKGIEGRVELVFTVQADGSVSDVLVEFSRPRGIFEKSAVRTVQQWRFKPGVKSGRPVATRVFLPLIFRIEE